MVGVMILILFRKFDFGFFEVFLLRCINISCDILIVDLEYFLSWFEDLKEVNICLLRSFVNFREVLNIKDEISVGFFFVMSVVI